MTYRSTERLEKEAEEIQNTLYSLDFKLKSEIRGRKKIYYMVSRDSAKVTESGETLVPYLSEEQKVIFEKASEELGVYDPMDDCKLYYNQRGARWEVDSPYEAKEALFKLGFHWQSGPWGTTDVQIAYKLRDNVKLEEDGELLDKAMDEWNQKHSRGQKI